MEETFARANANAELRRRRRGARPVAASHRARRCGSTASPARRCARGRGRGAAGNAGSPPAPRRSEGTPQPIFVVGADRSGASALACALGEHPAIAPARARRLGGRAGRRPSPPATRSALSDDSAAFGIDATRRRRPDSGRAGAAAFAGGRRPRATWSTPPGSTRRDAARPGRAVPCGPLHPPRARRATAPCAPWPIRRSARPAPPAAPRCRPDCARRSVRARRAALGAGDRDLCSIWPPEAPPTGC